MALASVQWSSSAWSNYDPTQVLANVIQGEAGSPEGQTAVATVIQNRLNAGSAGGFADTLQGVVQPSQFNGWQNAAPGSNAYQLAQTLIDGGTLPASAAGNSLYFASPASNNAWWANPSNPDSVVNKGVNIGGNFFSDVMGAPSSNFDSTGVAQANQSGSDPLGVFPLGGSSAGSGGGSSAGSSGGSSAGSSGASAAQESSWLEEIFNNTKDLFQRGVIGLLGVVLILGALLYLAATKRAEA